MIAELLTAALQWCAIAALAPLVVGFIQALVAALQGRRGPGPLQPYRDLRRLWGRSRISPRPHSLVYDLAPPAVAGATATALLLLPTVAGDGFPGLGGDAIVLVGLLAFGRLALALSAWDTGNGFSLIGAARDMAFAIFAEGLFLAAIAALALVSGGTSLAGMSAAASEPDAWQQVIRWSAILGLGLVVLAETGRRPIDNPETHLELTMVHEGPLLEYGGRDLALLKWSAMTRAAILYFLLVVTALPRPEAALPGALVLAGWSAALCLATALAESSQAKMRILRVPAFLGAGIVVVLLGVAAGLWGGLA